MDSVEILEYFKYILCMDYIFLIPHTTFAALIYIILHKGFSLEFSLGKNEISHKAPLCLNIIHITLA